MRSLSAKVKEDPVDIGYRTRILATTVIAIIVVHIPKCVAKPSSPIDWLLLCALVSCALMALFPLLLARIAPRAAGFNTQWFPDAFSQWGWFALLVVAILCASRGTFWVASILGLRGDPTFLFNGDVTRPKVVILGVLTILLYPTAEEIFWRGYLLEQLRKLMDTAIALLIGSILFSLAHLLVAGVIHSIAAFWFGVFLGLWRIKFRSLFPLILAHIILNAVPDLSRIETLYEGTPLLTKPKVVRINQLTHEHVSKALPVLVGLLSDSDQDVSNYASYILLTYYRNDAEPYLKEAFLSKDRKNLEALLFIVQTARYSSLKYEVRDVVFSIADSGIQLSAITTLMELHDLEGLQIIARDHAQEKTRCAALYMITKTKQNRKRESETGT
jgi:membrane protease YdiL (CAAX protease family)